MNRRLPLLDRLSLLVLLLAGVFVVGVFWLPSVLSSQEPQEWRGIRVAPENRCSPYDSDDYPYPQLDRRRTTAVFVRPIAPLGVASPPTF